MNHRLSAIVACSLVLGMVSGAHGQDTETFVAGDNEVVVIVESAGEGTCTFDLVLDGLSWKWNVTLATTASAAGLVFFTVEGAVGTRLGTISLQNMRTGVSARLLVQGGGAGLPALSADSVTATGSGETVIEELRTTGNVGTGVPTDIAIGASRIAALHIGGHVLGTIAVNGGDLNGANVAGSVRGPITVLGDLRFLWVVGDIETASQGPVAMNIRGSIFNLKAARINANIDTTFQQAG